MSELQITVFDGAGPTALGPVLLEEKITVSATSAQTTAMPGTRLSRIVRVFSDVNIYLTWGVNPTALTDGSDGRMIGADNPEYFQVPAGQKLAAITR